MWHSQLAERTNNLAAATHSLFIHTHQASAASRMHTLTHARVEQTNGSTENKFSFEKQIEKKEKNGECEG